MQARISAAGTVIAAILLAGSLAGLWFVLPGNSEIRLTGETLSGFARERPPKPWRGYEATIVDVSVDREVHIKAHVSGPLLHTPIEISGTPQYDTHTRAIFFRVSKVELPRESARPMLGKLNTMLNPLGSYIAKNLTDVIPVKRIKEDKRGEALFLANVKSVRVDGNAVAVELQGYHIAAAAMALILAAILAAAWLIAGFFRGRTRLPLQESASASGRQR